jgi:hypothetical protein
MSTDFHVASHGHDHTTTHKTHSLGQYVAMFTAILSTLGAVVSYQSGSSQNEAMLYKNAAVLKKAQASDQWNYYQAKSTKWHMIDLAYDLSPP